MNKVLTVFFDVKEIEKDRLLNNKPENCEFILFPHSLHTNFDEIKDKIKNVEILSIFTSTSAPGELLKNFPDLKLICARSTGFNNIDLEFCKVNNVAVVNVPRYGDCTVAEYTFGLLLDVMRKISFSYSNLKAGVIDIHSNMGHDLIDKTIGIMGTGAIGSHVIKIANGFGMNIICYDRYPKQELVDKYNVKYVEFDELLNTSDIISIHIPAVKENFHLINETAFNKMKKGVVIINTARGEIIDTHALYRAIKNNIVAGAGLDVLECEDMLANEAQYLMKIDCIKEECLVKTLINHKLLELPNVIVTPHVAFDTEEAVFRIVDTTIENINGFLNGKVVNRISY
jgi:D-lactate dehydrogenase